MPGGRRAAWARSSAAGDRGRSMSCGWLNPLSSAVLPWTSADHRRNAMVPASRQVSFGLALMALTLIAGIGPGAAQPSGTQTVATYHGRIDRLGNFVAPAMTWEGARKLALDPDFEPRFTGHLYAQ